MTAQETCTTCGHPKVNHNAWGCYKNCPCKKFELKEVVQMTDESLSKRIIGRQHRIHYSIGKDKILCGVKKWKCSDTEWKNVECKFCLKKQKAEDLI